MILPILPEETETTQLSIQNDMDSFISKAQPTKRYIPLLDIGIETEGLADSLSFERLKKIMLSYSQAQYNAFRYSGKQQVGLPYLPLIDYVYRCVPASKIMEVKNQIEEEVISQMLHKIGYTDGEGTFATDDAMTNMIAMIIARNSTCRELRDKGFNGQKYTLYTSEENYYKIVQHAGMIGIGRNNVRRIPCDKLGKMDISQLREQIIEDLCDMYMPIMINATAGTNLRGSFDSFEEIAQIAKEFNIWFHIDGTLGGNLALSHRYKSLLKGASTADSMSWNASPVIATSSHASVLLLKNKGLLNQHFTENRVCRDTHADIYSLNTDFLPAIQRNDALVLWAAWKFYGHTGYEARIDKLVELVQYATEIIENDADLELAQIPESLTVCFQVVNIPSEKICALLAEKGLAIVDYGEIRGENYIRLDFVNPDITKADVDIFFENIRQLAIALNEDYLFDEFARVRYNKTAFDLLLA